MKRVIGYFNEVRSELKKVVWPKKEEVIRLTTVVFLVSGIIGVYLGSLDYMFTRLLSYIIGN